MSRTKEPEYEMRMGWMEVFIGLIIIILGSVYVSKLTMKIMFVQFDYRIPFIVGIVVTIMSIISFGTMYWMSRH